MGLEKGTIEWGKWWSTDYYNKTYGIKKPKSIKPMKMSHSKSIFSGLLKY